MIGAGQLELGNRNRTLWFVLISLAIHSVVMLMLSRDWSAYAPTSLSEQSKPVDIEIVSLTAQEIERIKGQIVETSLTKKAEKAAKDAFLGQQTQVVERQTKAAKTASFTEGKKSGARGKVQAQRQSEPVAIGSLGVKMDFKPMGSLGPGSIAATNDHLKDLQQGAQTLLNTREYAYFSFYQRVRRQLEQYWEPGLRQRLKSMFDRGRRLAADHEHATRLTVVMDSRGSIRRIVVDDTSGMVDLDQAAVDAFNKAGPFPNPPRGLVEQDGTVKIEWEFVLKT